MTCTVSEGQIPDGWGFDGITPNSVVTIDQDTTEVTVTNTRLIGSLVVNKVAAGDPIDASTEFTVHVACSNGFEEDVALDVGTAGGDSATVGPIPSGVSCTVTEPTTPEGWTRVSIEPGMVVIGTDPTNPVGVTVTNERDVGTIEVEKVVEGDPAGSDATATIEVGCPGDDYDQTLIVPPGETVETGEIPTLLECTISEPIPPEGWDVTIDPDTVVVQGGPPVLVTVTNTRQTGEVTVVKRLVGPVAGADTEFTLELDCEAEGFPQTGHAERHGRRIGVRDRR